MGFSFIETNFDLENHKLQREFREKARNAILDERTVVSLLKC